MVTAVLIPLVDQNSADGARTIDVVVIGGQSNAAYVSNYMDVSVVNEEIPQVDEICYYYGYSNATVVRPINHVGETTHLNSLGDFPMAKGDQWRIGGEEVALASTIATHTHDDVLIINVALPGHEIAYYDPEGEWGTYAAAMIEDALSKIPSQYHKVNKAGWMWCQGESDKDTPVVEYIASFETLNAFFESIGFMNCYMVETKPSDSGNATEAQRTICNTMPNVVMASTAPAGFTVDNGGLIAGNTLHYSQSGRNIVGEQVGNAINNSLTIHLRDSPAYSLIAVIPLLIIVGLVLGVAGTALRNRD